MITQTSTAATVFTTVSAAAAAADAAASTQAAAPAMHTSGSGLKMVIDAQVPLLAVLAAVILSLQ